MPTFPPISVEAVLQRIEVGSSSVEFEIRESVERIRSADGELRCFCEGSVLWPDGHANRKGSLAGIALGVKDIFDTYDFPTRYGSPIYGNHRPLNDAALVAMARAAGATVVGKTETTEFAFLDPAPTRNPHDGRCTPGGSSSGSAAAVAAGLIPAAFGSQTAGSVIRPAAFCGVAGFKPSFRLLPTVGMKSFAWSLDTAGLFAGGIRDVALLAELLSGRPMRIPANRPPTSLRVGIYRSAVDDDLSDGMRNAVAVAAKALEQSGCRVLDIPETDGLTQARNIQPTIQLFEGNLSLLHERLHHKERLGQRLKEALDAGSNIEPAVYDEARRTARNGRREVNRLFEQCDVLLAPSAKGAAPSMACGTGDPVFNRLWTLAGTPCVNVPGLRDSSGMPLGISIISRFGRDQQALVGAALLEDCFRQL